MLVCAGPQHHPGLHVSSGVRALCSQDGSDFGVDWRGSGMSSCASSLLSLSCVPDLWTLVDVFLTIVSYLILYGTSK